MPNPPVRLRDLSPKQRLLFECGACGHSVVRDPAVLIEKGIDETTIVREMAPRARCAECGERSYKTRVTVCLEPETSLPSDASSLSAGELDVHGIQDE